MEPRDLSIVCCVEAGPLELMTVRMVESLRRFGGRFSRTAVYAVTPRFGAPLHRSTRRAFEDMDVRYLRFPARDPFEWNHFMNKPRALRKVAGLVKTEGVAWLDSDIVFLGEPDALLLGDGEDIAACPSDKNLGTGGAGDENEPYWAAICQALGIELESLPWITTALEQARIRLYWNSGVFVYRRASGFAGAFYEMCAQMLAARIASRKAGIFFTDQVALGLTAHRRGMGYRNLPYSHNFIFGSKLERPVSREGLKDARICHYHDFMWPDTFSRMTGLIEEHHPSVAQWLKGVGPLRNPSSLTVKVFARLLQRGRKRKFERIAAACSRF